MVEFLKQRQAIHVINSYTIVRKNNCSPNSGNKCKAHQGDKGNFEPHKFVGLQSLSSGKYVYVSFRNMDDKPFDPIAKGFDLSKFGDVSVFGVSILAEDQYSMYLFSLEVSREDAKEQSEVK